nr:asparagine synthase-related protein [Sphingomicrobium nitratireducens]
MTAPIGCWEPGNAPTPPSGASSAGGRWCWLDADLDNRDALASELDLPPDTDDATLVLALWRGRGSAMFAALRGEFAIALWDGERLIIARDALGRRPLFLRRRDGLHFGPSARALAGERPEADPVRLAQFLLTLPERGARSHFAGVDRVLAGEWIEARAPDRIERRRWWRPDLSRLSIGLEEAAGEATRLLDRAIGGMAHGRTAIQLSAGLDSNLLLDRMAARGVLPSVAITGAPDGPVECPPAMLFDETRLAAEAAAAAGVPHVRAGAPPSGLALAVACFDDVERPLFNPSNLGWIDATLSAARADGAAVMIEGLCGNYGVSWDPPKALAGMISDRDWSGAAALAGGIRGNALEALPRAVRRRLGGAAAWRLSTPRFVRPGAFADQALAPFLERGLFVDDPADRSWQPRRRLEDFYLDLDQASILRAHKARHGVRLRDPFADVELVEFTLRLPTRIFRTGSERRRLAKAMLSKRVPDAIRRGDVRAVQGANWRAAMKAERDTYAALVAYARAHRWLPRLIDLDALGEGIARWPREDTSFGSVAASHQMRALVAIAFVRWVEE